LAKNENMEINVNSNANEENIKEISFLIPCLLIERTKEWFTDRRR